MKAQSNTKRKEIRCGNCHGMYFILADGKIEIKCRKCKETVILSISNLSVENTITHD